tara:strand:+ start:5010 stop:6158 length:1149 start_codon:yes stop_codon:yes gene_type:complete
VKKILVVHNNYRDLGGEDIAVKNEINFLKKYYEVETLFFSNKTSDIVNNIGSLVLRNNIKSNNKFKHVVKNFKPDVIYIHNTWFQASLGIFDIASELDIKTIVKLHNFRYFCTRHYMASKHLNKNKICKACGIQESSIGKFNKYYSDSVLKSLSVINYGKKYFKILENFNLDILVLTDFHKSFLINLGLNEEKIKTYPNYLDIDLENKNILESDYIVYAGRVSEEKGVKELVKAFLEADVKNLKLKVVGKGPNLDVLKSKYRYKRIEFTGERSNKEVLDLISKSRAVVTATKLYEGQPTLLCEASALGVPSIFPDTGGIKEFFPNEYRLAFKQFDYEELKNKLKLLNNTKEVELIGAENKRFINNYLNENRLNKIFMSIHEK